MAFVTAYTTGILKQRSSVSANDYGASTQAQPDTCGKLVELNIYWSSLFATDVIIQKKMCSHDVNTETNKYIIRNIAIDDSDDQIVISFKSNSSCDEEQNHLNYKKVVGNILRGRDVIIVTKRDQLRDLISDAVNATDHSYVTNNAIEMASFTPHPESSVEHHATLLKDMPKGVAEDLATSTEFIYGNLWFLIPPNEINGLRIKEDVINDVRKLTPSTFGGVPALQYEAVASPAMYDGLEILWFKANENILFEQFAFKM